MGIGITASCRTEDWKRLSGLAAELAEQKGYVSAAEGDQLRVDLCHGRSMFWEHKDGGVEVDCQTNAAGPGFHAAAVELLDEISKHAGLNLEVDDETGFYTHRDFARMREEHFYSWLGGLLKVISEKGHEYKNLYICWDMDQYQPQDVQGTAASPTGRFRIQGLLEQVGREGIESFARDFFFWNERERDAYYYRNIALNLLWEDCYFMPADRSEEDAAILNEAISLLEQAAGMDRELPFPKDCYTEICRLARRKPMDLAGLRDLECEFPIGYRKGQVRHRLGNLTIPIHGSYLYQYEEERGHGNHVYFDAADENWHNVRLTAFAGQEERAEFDVDLFSDCAKPAETFGVGEGMCMAALAGQVTDEDGDAYYQVVAEVLSGTQITLITISFQRAEEESWAMELLRGMEARLPKKKQN